MSSHNTQTNQDIIKFTFPPDKNLEEHALFLSDHFPVDLFTQKYTLATADAISLHWHDEMQLVWVAEGKVNYFINGDSFTLDNSQLLFITSKQLHSSRLVDTDANVLYISFTADAFHPLVMKHCLLPIFEKTNLAYTTFPLKPYQILQLEELLNWEPNAYGFFSAMNFVSQAIEHLFKDFEEFSPRAVHEEAELIQLLLTYVHEHYAEPLTIKDLANHALLNKNKLTLLFKKYTNMSPIKYLNEYRLYTAKKLLIYTEDSVAEIGTEVGYNQTSHFIEQFRERYGLSPLKFRNKYKNNVM